VVSAPRLLVVGDGSGITGFSRVIRSILEPLSSRYQIHHLAVGYFGDPHSYPWLLYPAVVGGDDFGVKRIRNLAQVLKPDLIFLVSRLETVGDYLEELRSVLADMKVVAYCPVESGPIEPGVVARLAGLDKLVFYTRFAKKLFIDALAALVTQGARRNGNSSARTRSCAIHSLSSTRTGINRASGST
jgi:hypothetical protein